MDDIISPEVPNKGSGKKGVISMLQEWMNQNLLLYGMITAGMIGVICVIMVNHFYNRVMRDLHRITEPKSKWTKEFLSEYALRKNKQQKITNSEAFIRTQMFKGKILGVSLQKWKQGISLGAMACLLLTMIVVYGTYRYEEGTIFSHQYVIVGVGVFSLLLLMKQFMGFISKEDIIVDGYMDYMENMVGEMTLEAERNAIKEQAKEELIGRVTEGISQSAASGTRFSHMLSADEERIMREVIREYLT